MKMQNVIQTRSVWVASLVAVLWILTTVPVSAQFVKTAQNQMVCMFTEEFSWTPQPAGEPAYVDPPGLDWSTGIVDTLNVGGTRSLTV
jgi:hypothetical protein